MDASVAALIRRTAGKVAVVRGRGASLAGEPMVTGRSSSPRVGKEGSSTGFNGEVRCEFSRRARVAGGAEPSLLPPLLLERSPVGVVFTALRA